MPTTSTKPENSMPQWAVMMVVGLVAFFGKDFLTRGQEAPFAVVTLQEQIRSMAEDVSDIEEELKIATRSRYTQEDAARDNAQIYRDIEELKLELSRRSTYMDDDDKRHAELKARVASLETALLRSNN